MPLHYMRTVSVCLLLSAVATPLAAAADTETPAAAGMLSLHAAIQATLEKNPELQALAYRLQAQDTRVQIAGQSPALELSAQLENVLGSGEVSGVKGAEMTFALSRVIELGDKRTRRTMAAQAQRDTVTVERQAAQLDQLAEVTRRFIHVASDQKQLELTAAAVRLASDTVDAVKRRVDAAKSPEVELHRATVELIRAELELEHAEHELLSSRLKLAAMWGESQPGFAIVNADLFALPAPQAFESFVAQLERNPDFTRFTTAARLRDAEIRLAQAQRRADITVLAGVRRLEASDEQALLLGFTMPIGTRARAQPLIDEANALSEQLQLQQQSAAVNARANLFAIYQELRHAISEAQTLRDRVVPLMQAALRETEYAYERGRYSYLELVDAQRAYLDVQRTLIESSASAHTFKAELERLTAQPLADIRAAP